MICIACGNSWLHDRVSLEEGSKILPGGLRKLSTSALTSSVPRHRRSDGGVVPDVPVVLVAAKESSESRQQRDADTQENEQERVALAVGSISHDYSLPILDIGMVEQRSIILF